MIPYYNCEQYIAETIASIEAQHYPNIEIIIVDDGSREESAAFLTGLLKSKPAIHYATQNNRGVAAARNHAARLAKGEYFLFLDADDQILPDYVQKSVAALESNPDCKLVYPQAEFFDAKEGFWHLPPYQGIKSLLTGNRIPMASIHRAADFKALGGFDKNFTTHEDWDFWIRLLSGGGNVYQIPEVLFRYRKRRDRSSLIDGLEKNIDLIREDWQRVYEKHRSLFLQHELGYWDHIQTLAQSLQLAADNNRLQEQSAAEQEHNRQLQTTLSQALQQTDSLQQQSANLRQQLNTLQEGSTHLYQQIDILQQEKCKLKQSVIELSKQNATLSQHIQHEVKNLSKYKGLWTVKVFKPIIKTEQAISSANRYRKAFRILMREKGSFGKAYQTLRRMKKQEGIKNTKQFLKNLNKHYFSNFNHQLGDGYHSRYETQSVQYVGRTAISIKNEQKAVKVICFYLPQFHPFPENDKWWGKGFTEWTNVKPALPQYEGHYQPHTPHEDIGYYSLLDKKTQLKQIEMAQQYGIEGFCYYLYWFSGHRLMETPLDNMLEDKEIDFPFCICWANENWSRRWDGLDQDILIAQDYSDEDDIDFIKHISKYLKDSRYIHIEGKPLLVIYRPNLFPNMYETTQRWRKWCRENGIGEIYLAYPQSFEIKDPSEYDFDAAIEFPPNNSAPPEITKNINHVNPEFLGTIYDWRILLERSDDYTQPDYHLIRSVNPSWDNTARKKNKGIIFENSCPSLFEKYLINAFSETIVQQRNTEKRLVFVNAWNEWAEGAHLEPDQKYGYAWLQAVQNAHAVTRVLQNTKIGVVIHAFYPDILEEILNDLLWSKFLNNNIKLYITTSFEKERLITGIVEDSCFEYEILPCTNIGRDILPFLKILPKIKQDGVEYILKIHTKRSMHREDGNEWRKYLYSQLLSKAGFVHAITALTQNDKLAIISPDNHLATLSLYWGYNKPSFKDFCKRIHSSFSEDKEYKFVAGSMFYAKTKIFDDLLRLDLTDKDFDTEQGQIDGTLAHILERYFGVMVTEQGFTLEEINLPVRDNNAPKFL